MPTRCPVCQNLNPAEALYCHYDGRPLSDERGQGPMHIGSQPFPAPFYFADGQGCNTFNQLALACINRWDEARQLLVEGIWQGFFRNMGRLDLAAAAKEAAGDPDRDFGLSGLLERLPADPDCLRPPKLAVETTEVSLGQLAPGTDRNFELVLVNQGMLTLRGVIASNVDWLVLGDKAGPAQKMFQTRTFFSIRAWVLGNKLRAGLVPIQGELTVETNGGNVTIPVRADVPIKPFPKGVYANEVLAGATSPREVAKRAKDHAVEAAVLFEQGAVKNWYASNGWSYPVEGSQGSGKGAVQQFFEALGLTKPPRVEIDPTAFMLQARPGERVSLQVVLRTQEAKPVYAQAWSSQDWLTFGLIKYRGNQVRIPVEIAVPHRPGETVHAQVTVEGNGKQRFVVPVTVTVKPEAAPLRIESDSAPAGGAAPAWLRPIAWLAAGCLVTGVVLLLGTLALVILVKLLQR